MMLRMIVIASILLAACSATAPRLANPSAGRCLYATQDGNNKGRQTKWASCTSPPPLAIGIVSGPQKTAP
jgi:hypothetical protein